MILCGQRWYDPSAGRWLTRDPIGYAGGINLYSYCRNNPVMNADPSGLIDHNSAESPHGMVEQVQIAREVGGSPVLSGSFKAIIKEGNKNFVKKSGLAAAGEWIRRRGADIANFFRRPSNSPADAMKHEALKDQLREKMAKPVVENPKLQEMLGKIYRENAQIGSGSTAAAIRYELRTGLKVGGAEHIQKGREIVTFMTDWLKNNPHARPGDIAVAQNVLRDTQNALNGK